MWEQKEENVRAIILFLNKGPIIPSSKEVIYNPLIDENLFPLSFKDTIHTYKKTLIYTFHKLDPAFLPLMLQAEATFTYHWVMSSFCNTANHSHWISPVWARQSSCKWLLKHNIAQYPLMYGCCQKNHAVTVLNLRRELDRAGVLWTKTLTRLETARGWQCSRGLNRNLMWD